MSNYLLGAPVYLFDATGRAVGMVGLDGREWLFPFTPTSPGSIAAFTGDSAALFNFTTKAPVGFLDASGREALFPVAMTANTTRGLRTGQASELYSFGGPPVGVGSAPASSMPLTPVTVTPALDLDFLTAASIDARITVTRATTATYFDNTGTLQTAAIDTGRLDHNPATLARRGLLIEEDRVNSVSNNTMAGAAAGAPGTLPTNWGKTEASGLAFSVIGTGTEAGINYIDMRLSGTANAATACGLDFATNTEIAALEGQTWSVSAFLKIVGGSTAGLSLVRIGWQERSAGTAVAQQTLALTLPTSGLLSANRFSHSALNTGGSTVAYVKPLLLLTPVNGAAVDITVRIGMPQMENIGVRCRVGSAVVAAGGTGYTLGDTLVVVGGAGTAVQLSVTGVSAGAVTTVSVSTAWPGSYIIFPPSPASVTGGTGTGATFTLTPALMVLQDPPGFPTSVIATSAGTVTRAGDLAVMTGTNFSSWYNAAQGTLLGAYESTAVLTEGTARRVASISDGTTANRIAVAYSGPTYTGTGACSFASAGGTTQFLCNPPALMPSVGKVSLAYATDSFSGAYAGAAFPDDTSGAVPVVTQMTIGSREDGSTIRGFYLNGWVRRITYYSTRLSAGEVQGLST